MSEAWRRYHEATKHTPEKLRNNRHFLDWKNMPEPFRHYEGVPVLDLPADAPVPVAGALEVLRGEAGARVARDGGAFLSQLLFHAAAVSATKHVPSMGYRYALRVNPSSGNLHPTEFHFATLGLAGWPDGLYHYRPSSHMVEQRGRGDFVTGMGVEGRVVFVLTSIAWREAWKYQSRAYRYCCHDIGHAWEALDESARACGYGAWAQAGFADDAVAELMGVEDEWPMLLVGMDGPAGEVSAGERELLGGCANRLSEEVVEYPLIEEMHKATKVWRGSPAESRLRVRLPAPRRADEMPFAVAVRQRRSALDFRGGGETITREQLETLLAVAARDGGGFVELWVYVHRVDGVEPGLYRRGMEMVLSGDQRVAAAGLSLGQELAGNSCVTFSMIADLETLTALHGDRGYRYAHFEAGAIGQRLYVASEAMGFRSTGIGAFFDDAVHRYLDLEEGGGQVVYHFGCGHPVKDERLSG
ncbi:MAG: SagB/ThcOx family dehydrogenase [Acidobacteriia bacterium]|nr:SagB/ThcOx family dehydrogenase [Terriglobia bacterium]